MTGTTQVKMELTINGQKISRIVIGGRRLVDFIRDDLHLKGSKEGCGEGECGSCTVLLDGISVLSCLTPMEKANGRELTTIEGIESPTGLHPIQQALIQEGGIQCGFCTPGMVMSAVDLLSRNPSPTQEEIVDNISGNLCRCTGYITIIQAIENASKISSKINLSETGRIQNAHRNGKSNKPG